MRERSREVEQRREYDRAVGVGGTVEEMVARYVLWQRRGLIEREKEAEKETKEEER